MGQKNSILGKQIPEGKMNRAKELRRGMTAAEIILWQELRSHKVDGLHFRRQQIRSGLIVDYYCHQARMAIEVDGKIHDNQAEYDVERDRILTDLGLIVLRFRNDEVFNHLPEVLRKIRQAVCK